MVSGMYALVSQFLLNLFLNSPLELLLKKVRVATATAKNRIAKTAAAVLYA